MEKVRRSGVEHTSCTLVKFPKNNIIRIIHCAMKEFITNPFGFTTPIFEKISDAPDMTPEPGLLRRYFAEMSLDHRSNG